MTLKRAVIFFSLSLFAFIVNAQPNRTDYNAKWKQIDSLIQKKGLPQSALAEVNKLAVLARRENNDPQLIRTLIYRLSIEQSRSDSGVLLSIKDLETELATGNNRQPEQAILQNILAGLYNSYLQRNLYQIRDRTTTTGFVKKDVATWSVDDLRKKIRELYLASLANEEQLWQTPVTNYSPIVIPGNTPTLRLTLFDLLAHTALDYFKFVDRMTGQSGSDSSRGRHQAIDLLSRLIRRHASDRTPDALVDVEIERIVYEHQEGDAEGNKERYWQGLRRITDEYTVLPAAAEAWYLLAQEYSQQAIADVDQRDTSGNQKAAAICEQVLAQKDSSEGWVHCYTLLNNLRRKTLQLTAEKVNIPGRPFRVLVQWNNFSKLYLRLIRIDPNDEVQNRLYDSASWKKLLQVPILRAWTQDLPATSDLLPHQVEIAVGSLPAGDYALIAGTDAQWTLRAGVMGYLSLAVSRISWINQDKDYYVLDRENGQPLKGANVQVWEQSVRGSGNRLNKSGTYTTDEHGYFHLDKKPQPGNYASNLLEVTIPGDHYFPKDAFFYPYYGEIAVAEIKNQQAYESDHAKGYLFTDRAIYRPGQTVYFKGIEVTEDAGSHKQKPRVNTTIRLFLHDANDQVTDSLVLQTNEFGSYHGAFRLPEHQLNGNFSIQQKDDRAYASFRVEEYKRPKFFVDYDTLQGSYRVGDSVRITGFAKGYAGNGIDGAKVIYRITRRAHFRYSWLFWRRIMPVSQAEIQHGEIVTDGQGKFKISFFALPDKQVSPDTKPEYDYEVSADVTDLNGETRSGHTSVTAGYQVLRLSVQTLHGDRQPADSLRGVSVAVTNLAGTPVGADVTLKLYPLQAPQRLIRTRLWSAPDRVVLSEKEFLDSFPHDEYREESKREGWERGKSVWEGSVTVPASGKTNLSIPAGTAAPGWYLIEARTTDKYGQEVMDRQYVELYDGKTGSPAQPQYVWPSGEAITAEPGEKIMTATGSSAAGLYVIRTIERQGRKSFESFALDKGRKSKDWAITEADRGGFNVIETFVRENRIYSHATAVRVPWTNKELNVRYASYRDKTEPGSKEKWQVTISGAKGDKVSAEVLMAMYDASLDAFVPHGWSPPSLYPSIDGPSEWNTGHMFTVARGQNHVFGFKRSPVFWKYYDRLLEPGDAGRPEELLRRMPTVQMGYADQQEVMIRGRVNPAMSKLNVDVDDMNPANGVMAFGGRAISDTVLYNFKAKGNFVSPQMVPEPATAAPPVEVQARKDFRETAFFFPDLQTDSAGSVTFTFTMPEALTTWKWMTLAHTRDLAFGYSEKSIITQKNLMVQPNAPRFLREGDRMELPVKVSNLTDSEMTGQIHLTLTDPTTGETADGWFTNRQANQYFTVPAHQSVVVGFPLDIPYQYNRPLTYTVTAEAKNYGDGEEATLPVVSNRMLVTESLPLNMPGDGTKHFTFGKLATSGSSETLSHHALTVEFTANPAWYAVQALPYLMEYPYECAEQTFNRAYANALATNLVMSNPRLKQVFDKWRTTDTAALLSNLQKNQELKSVLLEETPWVIQGKSEEQQKKNIALLFDLDRMSRELESSIDRLSHLQSPDGGFPWFEGGPDDRYITQYILTGIGRLRQWKAVPPSLDSKIKAIVTAALPWLDAKVRKEYEDYLAAEKRNGKGIRPLDWISPIAIEYLYMRSFFNDYGTPGGVLPAVSFYRKQAQKNWVGTSRYLQGMTALALFRTGDVQTAKDILASLKQNAIRDEEKGMYWKGMETGGYYWYQAPVETQALLIEAFREISGDAGIDRQLKTWLLRQKQTHSWPTTKATADACYALMMGGQQWLNAERNVSVTLGNKKIDWPAGGSEAGTGYNKKVFDAPFVNPSMGNITVTMTTVGANSANGTKPAAGASAASGGSPAWGAVYWQYFDMLDKITPPGAGKTLRIDKLLFTSRNTDRGPVLEPLGENGTVRPGDKVVVRIVITSDRDLEYVHMKDMRGACFEPVNVLSQYKWQDGLGYYESTKDASTDFFFGWLPKGTHVFEYAMFTGQAGNFSNGVTSIECMYAPEFSFHSEGIRVNVEAAR